ncbi:PREDICTED: putative tripartite motif-containing protein 75-like [Elephantulus edwardii]|uniref:putative tripartite motif-containing protein 75-like n=1 Tax=Elephantulus edwardii TaxID=28737 RepID=UPI0003F0B7B4|nr:PREDICTED: putative tripartite motif-containing protein 75-like [Elephantulus edwardii]
MTQVIPYCPVCRHQCTGKNYIRNIQLGHLIDIFKLCPPKKSETFQKKNQLLCQKHKQPLFLFCEEHMLLICPQCALTSTHKNHSFRSVE